MHGNAKQWYESWPIYCLKLALYKYELRIKTSETLNEEYFE